MKKNSIFVFSNDNLYQKNNYLYYQNKNTLTLIDLLNEEFEVCLISRKNKFKTIGKKKIPGIIHETLFSLIKKIMISRNYKFFFISITPHNFLYFLFLKLFLIRKEKIFVFLRSDGFKEYQIKFPILGYYLYFFMFKLICLSSIILSCSKYFEKLKDYKILLPSELDENWYKKNLKNKIGKKINILYVGRFRKEKGYLSLIYLFKKVKSELKNFELNLTLVGSDNDLKLEEKNIKIIKQITNINKLKKVYDRHQIFVLPSFTEGFPQVILESFSRKIPVIVFEEIGYLKKTYHNGLFVSERNEIDFTKTIEHIIINYSEILKKINKIKLVSKEDYKLNLIKKLKN